MITMDSWMFLSSYEKLRKKVIQKYTLRSLAHFPYEGKKPTVIGINFGVAAVSAQRSKVVDFFGTYCCSRYFEISDDGVPFRFPTQNERLKVLKGDDFKKIPGNAIIYYYSDGLIRCFDLPYSIRDAGGALQGLATTNNERFLRYWFEVARERLRVKTTTCKSAGNEMWVPHMKGGPYRRWHGNNDYVINWEGEGKAICDFIDETPNAQVKSNGRIINKDKYFTKGATWSHTSSSKFSARLIESESIFNMESPSIFGGDTDTILALLNSSVAWELLKGLSPSLHFLAGTLTNLPVPFLSNHEGATISKSCITLSRADWNAYERSWNFQSLPLLTASSDPAPTIESSYTAWIANNKQTIAEMKRLEEENNRLFIDAYGLQDELNPEVPIEQITLTVNPAYRYGGNLSEDELWIRFRQDTIKELLSYATGCMMGRYSLDHPGLILANAGDTLEHFYEKVHISSDAVAFQPDRDGILPVLDGEWFEDDIVARSREFLRVTFPASSLNTDLAFIETALGKDLRKYFCTDFYKDHLQTYKKRPIYWLVQSPSGPAKGGFACLVYLHRYTKDTLNLVLNNYFRPYLQKLEARQAQLGLDQLNDALPSRDRTAARKEAEKITKVLKECQAWEQDSLLPLAQQRIELDLDDGVKVNYLKLQDVLAPIPGLAAKEE
jgi:hypothetical protein